MDLKKLAECNKRFDSEFCQKHQDFVAWWAKHPHNDPNPIYAVNPRIAYKCACYQDEFLEAKSIGAV